MTEPTIAECLAEVRRTSAFRLTQVRRAVAAAWYDGVPYIPGEEAEEAASLEHAARLGVIAAEAIAVHLAAERHAALCRRPSAADRMREAMRDMGCGDDAVADTVAFVQGTAARRRGEPRRGSAAFVGGWDAEDASTPLAVIGQGDSQKAVLP